MRVTLVPHLVPSWKLSPSPRAPQIPFRPSPAPMARGRSPRWEVTTGFSTPWGLRVSIHGDLGVISVTHCPQGISTHCCTGTSALPGPSLGGFGAGHQPGSGQLKPPVLSSHLISLLQKNPVQAPARPAASYRSWKDFGHPGVLQCHPSLAILGVAEYQSRDSGKGKSFAELLGKELRPPAARGAIRAPAKQLRVERPRS